MDLVLVVGIVDNSPHWINLCLVGGTARIVYTYNCWITSYLLDRVICPLNNWVLYFFRYNYHKELSEEAQVKSFL